MAATDREGAHGGTAVALPSPSLAGWLRRLRQARGLTQEALAHDLGVTVSTVNRWEQGHAQPCKLAQRALRLYARQTGEPPPP